ncbi:hypothetical protein HX005_06790 [Acinetobacter sp. R933-2]|uniref:hypothetical protein n=1 Tax=Acinetobacter sp. R933-2 TaxID=2746728 RepID=UPI002578FEBE|nr:hypothetical protein [Acinetobacter sp. R933-2]MDM1247088.1 hypothetical protein [Acinetobacter sp. R933-2]
MTTINNLIEDVGGIDFPIELAIGMLQAESKRLELGLKSSKRNETKMTKFEQWFTDYHNNNEAYAETIARDAFEVGQQSRQAEIDLLQQYNDDLARGQCCLYRELKERDKRIETVLKMLEGDLKYVEQDRRENFEFLQMAMIRCLKDDIKRLRGDDAT